MIGDEKELAQYCVNKTNGGGADHHLLGLDICKKELVYTVQ